MDFRRIFIGALAASALASQALGATTVDVPATGDLYLAGAPDGTHCCNQDSAPTESPTLVALALVPGEILTFAAPGGANYEPGSPFPTADGETGRLYNLQGDYGTGISGPQSIHLAGLAGLFLGPSQPSGPAPLQLSGTSYAALAPGLDQIFFIGDGLTGTGTGAVQQFTVPEGATRLFLGVADDGGYFDNTGEITATITPSLTSAAPEPAAWALMLVGVGLIGAASRRARRPSCTADQV